MPQLGRFRVVRNPSPRSTVLLAALLVLTTLPPLASVAAEAIRGRVVALSSPAREPAPYYGHVARAVSNWRTQAGAELRPVSLALVAQVSPIEPAFVARCAKLNNYWCIKSARWSGEIGADAEGHTGFATAADGADAAASLLRRYYRDYGRRTALAIVRRWAPAACGLPGGAAPVVAGSRPAFRTPRGIGGTLRARYLARHLPGGAPRGAGHGSRTALRVQPWSALARMNGHPSRRPARPIAVGSRPVRDIAAGISDEAATRARSPVPRILENPADLLVRKVPSPDRLAAESALLPLIAAGPSLAGLGAPPPLCADDTVRIGNYAEAMARSVGLRATDDLVLFSGDGSPLANLAPVMRAMSAVELGSLHAGASLVAAAVARLRPVSAASADAAR